MGTRTPFSCLLWTLFVFIYCSSWRSSDSGKTILKTNKKFNKIMRRKMRQLNLQSHICGFDPNKTKRLRSAADIEGHLGTDQKVLSESFFWLIVEFGLFYRSFLGWWRNGWSFSKTPPFSFTIFFEFFCFTHTLLYFQLSKIILFLTVFHLLPISSTSLQFYLLDFSRTMPPLTPDNRFVNGHLYRLMRPEFVSKYKIPLCSDAFSGFNVCDPNAVCSLSICLLLHQPDMIFYSPNITKTLLTLRTIWFTRSFPITSLTLFKEFAFFFFFSATSNGNKERDRCSFSFSSCWRNKARNSESEKFLF